MYILNIKVTATLNIKVTLNIYQQPKSWIKKLEKTNPLFDSTWVVGITISSTFRSIDIQNNKYISFLKCFSMIVTYKTP